MAGSAIAMALIAATTIAMMMTSDLIFMVMLLCSFSV
jgi:hypothetical protein